MKAIYYKLLFLIFLLPGLVLSNTDDGKKPMGKHKKQKTITKEFDVDADAVLQVINSYGNVHITSWDKNKVEIEVLIKTNGNSEESVQEKLDGISVDFEHSAKKVYAKTTFKKEGSKSWWRWNKKNNVNVQVNYTIKVPVSNSVDLNNDYGGIFIDKIEGKAKISCDYGKMEIGELLGDHNYLNFDYTNNVSIDYMKNGKINADYSSFTIEKAGDIDLNADYTKSHFITINNIDYNCDYNNLIIDKANNIKGNGEYLSLKLGAISGTVDVKASYGAVKIAQLLPEAKNVYIQSDFARIKIGVHHEYNFKFDITLDYASLRDIEGFEYHKKRVQSTSKYYEGYYLQENSPNTITISSEYGSVNFEKH